MSLLSTTAVDLVDKNPAVWSVEIVKQRHGERIGARLDCLRCRATRPNVREMVGVIADLKLAVVDECSWELVGVPLALIASRDLERMRRRSRIVAVKIEIGGEIGEGEGEVEMCEVEQGTTPQRRFRH